MSESHNKRTVIKLTPQNAKAVKEKAKQRTKMFQCVVSNNSVANLAIEIGIKKLD